MVEKLKDYYPVLGENNALTYNLIDIGALQIPEGASITEMNQHLEKYIRSFENNTDGIPYGGFLERRILYQFSNHFSGDDRNIHLGIDLWIPADTPIYAAKSGHVHSIAYNSAPLDYGWCIIMDYGNNEFVLYGHMSGKGLKDLKKGEHLNRGQIIGYTGDYHENGGWVPHLHLQVMNTMLDYKGDFPGVSNEKDLNFYLTIIKDPFYLL